MNRRRDVDLFIKIRSIYCACNYKLKLIDNRIESTWIIQFLLLLISSKFLIAMAKLESN